VDEDQIIGRILQRSIGPIQYYRDRWASRGITGLIALVGAKDPAVWPHVEMMPPALAADLDPGEADDWATGEQLRVIADHARDPCPAGRQKTVIWGPDGLFRIGQIPVPAEQDQFYGPNTIEEEMEGVPAYWKLRELEEADETRIDLVAIWEAAGRPHLSPRRWLAGREEDVTFGGKRAGDPVWCGFDVAYDYLERLEEKFLDCVIKMIMKRSRLDPAGQIMGAPESARGLVAFTTTMAMMSEGVTATEVVAEVFDRTEGMAPEDAAALTKSVSDSLRGIRGIAGPATGAAAALETGGPTPPAAGDG
jgi:hypothetical protein